MQEGNIKPAFHERNIPVALSADVNYLPYAKVLLRSILANTKSGNLDIFILEGGIPEEGKEQFLRCFADAVNCYIRFLNIGEFAEDQAFAKFVSPKYFTVAALYRLLLPDLLTEYDKLIYLDVDTVVCRDLGELFAIDIGDNLFGAAIDIGKSGSDSNGFNSAFAEWARGYGFTEWDGYVNSGVMLMNLEGFRKAKLLGKLLPIAVDAAKWFVDQDALNFVCKERIATLDPRWNVQVGDYCVKRQLELTKDEMYICHFAGHKKPWRDPDVPFSQEWWRYVDFANGVAFWRQMFPAERDVRIGDGICVSVIVPVYNAGHYLKEMLISLSAQTLENIEIICIDDGSTDSSAAILAECSDVDSRIRVVRQENSGAAIARNRGIDEARGKWLFFADADDFCEPQMLERMAVKGDEEASDVVVAGRVWIDQRDGGRKVSPVPAKYCGHNGPVNCTTDGINVFEGLSFAPWNKLTRKDFVIRKGLRFHLTPTNDDTFFVLSSLLAADRISFQDGIYYHYRRFVPTSQMGQADKYPLNFLVSLMEVKDIVAGKPNGVKKQFSKAALVNTFENLFQRRTTRAAMQTLEALRNGGLENLLFPEIGIDKINLGYTRRLFDMVLAGEGLYEITNEWWRERTSKIDAAVVARDEMKAKRDEAVRKRDALVAAHDEMKAKRDEAARKRDAALAAYAAMKDKRDEAVRKCDAAVAARDEMKAQRDEAVRKCHAAVVARDEMKAKRDEAVRKCDAAVAARDEMKAKRDEAVRKCDALVAARDEMKVKRDEAVRKCDALVAARDEMKVKRDEAVRKCDALVAARDEMKAKRDEAVRKCDALVAARDEMKAKRDEASRKCDVAVSAYHEMKAKRDVIAADLETTRKELRETLARTGKTGSGHDRATETLTAVKCAINLED